MLEFKIAVLGVLQGITEFLPISSSGHLVIFEYLFNISNDNIVIEVVLHFGTLISILIYFRDDIFKLFKGVTSGNSDDLIYFKHLVLATIPIVLAGLFLKDYLVSVFSIEILMYTYVFNAVILLLTRYTTNKSKEIDLKVAFLVGCSQVLALLPGVSRAGMTICAGLFLGCDRKNTAKFSFFLAIPALIGAIILESKNIITQFNIDPISIFLGFIICLTLSSFHTFYVVEIRYNLL